MMVRRSQLAALPFGGVGAAAGYILYDTSQIMHHLGPDDYVEGAISLYLDVRRPLLPPAVHRRFSQPAAAPVAPAPSAAA